MTVLGEYDQSKMMLDFFLYSTWVASKITVPIDSEFAQLIKKGSWENRMFKHGGE